MYESRCISWVLCRLMVDFYRFKKKKKKSFKTVVFYFLSTFSASGSNKISPLDACRPMLTKLADCYCHVGKLSAGPEPWHMVQDVIDPYKPYSLHGTVSKSIEWCLCVVAGELKHSCIFAFTSLINVEQWWLYEGLSNRFLKGFS